MEKRGVLESINRLRATIQQIFAFALARGLIENNVVAGTSGAFVTHQKEHFRALPSNNLHHLVQALCSNQLSEITRMAALWQLLTISRPGEAVQAQWNEIEGEGENQIWRIPAEKMKKRREHIAPLSPQARDILDKMRPTSGNLPYIFPSRDKKSHTNREVIHMACNRLDDASHEFATYWT